MKIGIDARSILNPEKGDAIGVGHYTYQLIRHLLKIDKENEYVLFFDFRVREKDVAKFKQDNVKIKYFPFSDYKKYLPGAYNEILGAATLQGEKLNVLHGASALNRIPITYSGKCVMTIHDMSAFVIPENLSKINAAKDRAVLKMMSKKAEKIIAPSESLKSEIEKYLKVEPEKIEIVQSGIDKRFFEEGELSVEAVAKKFNITKKYILFLGTLEPSKNIARLLNSFAQFKTKRTAEQNSEFDYQLVLGGKRGWLSQEYKQIIKDLGLSNDVLFTGYVIGDELVPLFKGAEFFVMPSLYEGFGMTVLESLATQTPAIVSKISSIPEIADGAALLIDPHSEAEIAEALEKMSSDENLRNELKTKGLIQAQKFSWEDTARKTLEIYKSLGTRN